MSTLIEETEAEAAHLAVRLVGIAETLRLVSATTEPGVDRSQVLDAVQRFAQIGVGHKAPSLESHFTAERLALLLREVLAAVEESPMPDREWVPMSELLGEELLTSLAGVSVTSLHRYRNGDRKTPDPVAARLHVLVLIISDLAGSYNEFGIRRWFQRPRAALGGQAPAQILTGAWSPDETSVRSVRELAHALLGASVA